MSRRNTGTNCERTIDRRLEETGACWSILLVAFMVFMSQRNHGDVHWGGIIQIRLGIFLLYRQAPTISAVVCQDDKCWAFWLWYWLHMSITYCNWHGQG